MMRAHATPPGTVGTIRFLLVAMNHKQFALRLLMGDLYNFAIQLNLIGACTVGTIPAVSVSDPESDLDPG